MGQAASLLMPLNLTRADTRNTVSIPLSSHVLGEPMQRDKVKSPFDRLPRNQLLSWSKLAKERGVLTPFERKVL